MNEDLDAFGGESVDAEMTSQTLFQGGQAQAGRQAPQVAPAAGSNAVVLAEGQAIERLEADGSDLVIILTDGTRILVPDGIILVPEIIVDGTQIPPANVAALLVGNEPEPAAGPNPSSGGNFAVDPTDIQAAFDLGDLLPYTELPVALEVEEEIIPVPASDDEVTFFDLERQPSEVVLDEDDLPDGTDGSDSLIAERTFGLDAPDGLVSVRVNGVDVVVGGRFSGPVEVSNDGIYSVVITGWTPVFGLGGNAVVSAVFSYRVTLLDNTLEHTEAGEDVIARTLTITAQDRDGSDATASLDVRIIDDVPTANADADSVTEDGPLVADGNVLTGTGGSDANTTDGVADLRGADGASVTAVAFGATTGTVGTALAGLYGTLTLNADGSYSYVLDNNNPLVQGLAAGETLTEVFTYTITDGDGDTATTTLTITINGADDGVVINGLDVNGGEVVVDEDDLADGSSPDAAALTRTGTFTIETPDGLDTVTIAGVTIFANGAFIPGQTIDTPAGLLTITGFTPVTDANGTVIGATISYSYLLQDPIDHTASGEDSAFESFEVIVTDTDGSDATASLDVRIIDDVPTALGGTSTGTVDEDGLTGGIPGGTGDVAGAPLSVSGSISGFFSFGADGQGSYGFVGEVDVQAALEAQGLSSGGIDLAYEVVGNTITATKGIGGADIFTFTLNASTGSWTFTLLGPLDHAPGGDENDLLIQFGGVIQATDGDGDVALATGAVTVTVDDDTPVAFVPAATSMADVNGAIGVFSLDTVNGDVDDNLGADGRGGAIFTAATIAALEAQNLTSGLAALAYTLSSDGKTLIASKSTDGTEVFRITLEPSGFEDQYVVEISQPVDASSDVDFNDGGYDFVGGNASWFGFIQPGDNDSRDLLLTPIGGGTVNTNAQEGGIAAGNSVGSGEAMRVDYVIDLTGSPVNGGDFNDGDDTQSFDGHYNINGGSAFFTQINTASTVRISAFDDDDSGILKNVGDGTPDPITSIAISFNGDSETITASGTYTIGGRAFTVTFNGGVVDVAGVGDNTRIAAFTADGYNSIEWAYVGGNTFKIGDFGATVVTDNPVSFEVPVFVSDGDGDIVPSGNLDITLNPVSPLLVLDLDGDGVEFVGTQEGVTFDFDGDGIAEATAWAGADDGILVLDANGNGVVDSAAELVFNNGSPNALAGLSALDTAGLAGFIDDADPIWTQLKVWQDANQNGVVDSGEMRTLDSLGIDKIAVSDNGVRYSTANGEVVVQGTASFTTDGTGSLPVGTYALANALVDPIQPDQLTAQDANGKGYGVMPVAANDAGAIQSEIEQRLAPNAITQAALAGILVGVPLSAAAQGNFNQSASSSPPADATGNIVAGNMAFADDSSVEGSRTGMLEDDNIAPKAEMDLGGRTAASDGLDEATVNPLDDTADQQEAVPSQDWAVDETPLPGAMVFDGPGATDAGMMKALLLLGSEETPLPGNAAVGPEDSAEENEPEHPAADEASVQPVDAKLGDGEPAETTEAGSGTDVPATDPAPSAADTMDALLLIVPEDKAMPTQVDLLGNDLSEQTVADALAGEIIDKVIDEFAGTSGNADIASGAASSDQLIDLLSFDLSGGLPTSATAFEPPAVDEAAQAALVHG
ncbi:MAG: VCBS domain-containing protein [Erythrobacter sp.]|nr:VCBS domain-containing protein [Erythrobacter sp.]